MWDKENIKYGSIKESDFSAILVKKSEVDIVRKNSFKISDVVSTFNNITASNDVIEELTQFGNTLMRGVQTFKDIKKEHQLLGNVYFDVDIDGNKVTISKISFIAGSPDEYAIIFGVNGIYTDILTENWYFNVEDDISVVKIFFDYTESGILIAFYFIVLVFSSKMIKGYTLFIAIILTGIYIYLVSLKSYATELYMATVFLFAGLVGIFLIWACAVYFIDVCIKKQQPGYFYNRKEQYFIEYVYQRLNGHPSNYWINSKRKLGMDLKGYYNFFSQNEESDLRKSDILPKSIKDEESKEETPKHINDTSDEYKTQSQHSLLSDDLLVLLPNEYKVQSKYSKNELRSIPVDVIPYNDLSLKNKFIRILTPFEVMYKKVWVNDWFIYPQVLLTCITISLFSIVSLGFLSMVAVINLSKAIEHMYDKVYSSAFSFIRNAIERYFILFKYETSESDISSYYDQLQTFSNIVDQLIFAIKLGAIIGIIAAVISVFVNIFYILLDYKRRVLHARIGIFEFNRRKIEIQNCAKLPGGVISNSIFMFYFFIFVTTLIFSIIAWPVTWKILWYLKWSLLSILSGTILNFIIIFIMNKIWYGFDFIKNRTLLSIFDFFLLQLAILAGIVSAISRFGVLCIVLLISILRIDVSSSPEWFSNYFYLDNFNKAYYASILIQHTHNNPILITFTSMLYKITLPVNSNDEFDDEMKKSLNL